MSSHRDVVIGDRTRNSIHIGGIFASRRPAVVHTILGSCVAVCLRDPISLVGGMNHFMLPYGSQDETANSRYGVHAMELLINECMNHGADRRRIEAKLFGGGHVLNMRETDGNVPQINIRFALEFMETERIPIVSKDLGGYAAREVVFFTDSGRTMVRRLSRTGTSVDKQIDELEREERTGLRQAPAPPAKDNITLF